MSASKSSLAVALSKLKLFSKPDVKLEQYPTDSEIAAEILWNAHMRGDLDNKIVADLGCGTGILGIGALLLGAKKVFFVDIDKNALEILKQNFSRVKKFFWNKPFQRAKTFQKAYLTDMIQELVDIGIKVHCVIIERGWKEIDTVEDYKKALIDFKR